MSPAPTDAIGQGTGTPGNIFPDQHRKGKTMTTKIIAATALPAALAVIFYLTDVPAWAWALPVAVLVIEAAMIARAHRIDARR